MLVANIPIKEQNYVELLKKHTASFTPLVRYCKWLQRRVQLVAELLIYIIFIVTRVDIGFPYFFKCLLYHTWTVRHFTYEIKPS
jgi:hypothetical protein